MRAREQTPAPAEPAHTCGHCGDTCGRRLDAFLRQVAERVTAPMTASPPRGRR